MAIENDAFMKVQPAAAYSSRFLKADRRTLLCLEGCQIHRTAFDHGIHIDDVFLSPGASFRPEPVEGGSMLLLPIAGGALWSSTQDGERPLLPGAVYHLPAIPGGPAVLTNPFDRETVNLLLIRMNLPLPRTETVAEAPLPLDAKNRLTASTDPALPLQVGVYDSRTKDTIGPVAKTDQTLCYVINGSFEIEDRLAEYRDALLLWDGTAVDFEALSEAAILLHIHIATNPF